jgi:SSS family solute:Na+ symporter
MKLDMTATIVFVSLFLFVTILGFYAARWKQADLHSLDEWGLAGRRFGTWITWFLLGGDLYTAYTFIAVPALLFGMGAFGFFGIPYTILIYPLAFMILPRLWSVSRKHGFVTPADFIRARYNSPLLALAIAVTGILATMPYVALQLVGIEVIIGGLGVDTSGALGELPLIVAFIILAAYTYTSGLRAPAMIAVVKDILIYITIIAAFIIIPMQLGGFGKIFAAVPAEKLLLKAPTDTSLNQFSAYFTLALGSALALFLYPHSMTAALSSNSANTLRKNMILLPAYSVLLGLIALLGYMAIASGVKDMPEFAQGFAQYGNNFAIPALFIHSFPSWFVGVAFAAIGIGALVPAAIMSIAAANLYTRNIHKEFINPAITPRQETFIAKNISLAVKFGALLFVLFIPTQYAINLQLLGGVWIIQVLPAVFIGLYTRWFDHRALMIGWLVGMISGSLMAYSVQFKPIYTLIIHGYSIPGYSALYALVINLFVAATITLALRFSKIEASQDLTVFADYESD